MMAGWIEAEAPNTLQDDLFAQLDDWQADQARPLAALWHTAAQLLRQADARDAEESLWQTLLALAPGEPAIYERLGDCRRRLGDAEGAQDAWSKVPPGHPSRVAALVGLMGLAESDVGRLGAEAAALLLDRAPWGGPHHGLVAALAEHGQAGMARDFLAQWTDRHGVAEDSGLLLELGWLAMKAGDAGAARGWFQRLWALDDPAIRTVAGRFDGTVPPYDEAIEAAIKTRIDDAFAIPEGELARVVPQGPPFKGTSVLFASFKGQTLPNDLAWHFTGSARAAGVAFQTYLDDAIVFPAQFSGSDGLVAERVAAFEAHLAAAPPDILILDCAYMPAARGLTPMGMRALADRLGFTLVGLMRDALADHMDYLRAWADACDRVLVYDPKSPILADSKARVLWGQVQHLTPPAVARGSGLLFLGADSYGVRNMLLSVLATSPDLEFAAITGAARAKECPDFETYMARLAGAGAVLNIAAHSRDGFLVTGRVFEAIALGAVLIEQDNPATSAFFTPWRHYLPWTDVADIVQLARFVARNPDQADRIRVEARRWLDLNYDCGSFWRSLVEP
jgi:hypothetical protein